MLDEEGKTKFSFGEREDDPAAAETLRNAEVVGACPVCKKGTVRNGMNAYLCDRSLEKEDRCSFRIGKMILQREIIPGQAAKLLISGKTDLIPGFVSKKGRKFSAYLKLEANKVSFEFEPRQEKGSASSKKAVLKKTEKPSKPRKTLAAKKKNSPQRTQSH